MPSPSVCVFFVCECQPHLITDYARATYKTTPQTPPQPRAQVFDFILRTVKLQACACLRASASIIIIVFVVVVITSCTMACRYIPHTYESNVCVRVCMAHIFIGMLVINILANKRARLADGPPPYRSGDCAPISIKFIIRAASRAVAPYIHIYIYT